jgi:hypothetical protein
LFFLPLRPLGSAELQLLLFFVLFFLLLPSPYNNNNNRLWWLNKKIVLFVTYYIIYLFIALHGLLDNNSQEVCQWVFFCFVFFVLGVPNFRGIIIYVYLGK